MEFFYRCSECGRTFDISPDLMLCPHCSTKQKRGEPLRGVLEVVFDDEPANFIRTRSATDIFELLPVEKHYFADIPVGNTPLWSPARLRAELGFKNLFLKDDTRNPTGSLKDRASYLVAAFARKHGIENIALASTGNAAASMAGISAAFGLKVKIFIPKDAPREKAVQCLQYGAELELVDGSYDDAYELAITWSGQNACLNRNTAYNPLTIEGKKTAALEIFCELQNAPDYVFVPVGDGVILAGIYKGFSDLLKLNLIGKIPTIYAVQAENSDAIARAFNSGKFEKREVPLETKTQKAKTTIADSISVAVPANGYFALQLLKRFSGKCITVSDAEILLAQKELASKTGLFAEPAAAAAFAGFKKSANKLAKDAVVVLLLTGTGLKDIKAASILTREKTG